MTVQTDSTLQLLQDLVSIDSVNPSLVPGARGEAEIARRIASECTAAGLTVHVTEVAPGRPNVVGVLEGRAKWCHTAGVCLQVWGASLKGQLPQVQREIVAVKEHGTHGLSITLPLRPAGKVSDSSEILHTVVNELADPRDIHVSIFGSVF